MKWFYALCAGLGLVLGSYGAMAAVSEQQAKRLEGDLTPMGAERAGNAAGTIPAWEGGLTSPPEGLGYQPGGHHPDPYAADKPLYTISPANRAGYDSQLTGGHKAMLTAYPDSFSMNVYPTRRSCAYPPRVYQAVKRNATGGQLTHDGNSITGALMAAPFPIPQSAREVLWNHELNFRGFMISRPSVSAAPTKSGDFTIEGTHDQFIYRWSDPAFSKTEELDNVNIYVIKEGLSPPSSAGQILVMHNTIDQVAEERRAWFYKPGERRLKRMLASAYDSPIPGSEGMRTNDNMAIFNGAGDRYDWELLGKQEKLLPYNTYRFGSPELGYREILHKQHLNPEPMRYELHRAWVVEGRLKAGQKHSVTARRTFYMDEDSWIPAVADLYDASDELNRVQEGHVVNYYEVPLCTLSSDVIYDLNAGRYHVMGLRNQETEVQFNANLDPDAFSPEAARRIGVR